jgi:hypothetical protein
VAREATRLTRVDAPVGATVVPVRRGPPIVAQSAAPPFSGSRFGRSEAGMRFPIVRGAESRASPRGSLHWTKFWCQRDAAGFYRRKVSAPAPRRDALAPRRSFVIPFVTAKRTAKCGHCRRRFRLKATGRPAVYCSPACRQWGYVKRKANRPHPVELLAGDLTHFRVREWLHREIWAMLVQADLVQDTQPPPLPPNSRQSKLRLVRTADADDAPT